MFASRPERNKKKRRKVQDGRREHVGKHFGKLEKVHVGGDAWKYHHVNGKFLSYHLEKSSHFCPLLPFYLIFYCYVEVKTHSCHAFRLAKDQRWYQQKVHFFHQFHKKHWWANWTTWVDLLLARRLLQPILSKKIFCCCRQWIAQKWTHPHDLIRLYSYIFFLFSFCSHKFR